MQALRNYLPKERLMASTLYQEIRAEGRAEGIKQGVAEVQRETILQVLTYRLGEVEPSVRERIQSVTSAEMLVSWQEEALRAVTAKAARRLAEKIKKAPLA